MTIRTGVYPGTFDPITLGHMDIIRRGAKLVDRLVIGVTTNIAKSPLFDDDERIEIVRREVATIGNPNIDVVGFSSLLMDFADSQGRRSSSAAFAASPTSNMNISSPA